MLSVEEHRSGSYAPRTFANAKSADMTVAVACDFKTAGEALTRKAAGVRYLGLHLPHRSRCSKSVLAHHRSLVSAMCDYRTLNIAGNGIYTLVAFGWTQESVNSYVYRLLRDLPWLRHVRCGGQTGVDLAGAVAGVALGLPTTVLMPKGYLMRDANGTDAPHTQSEVTKLILGYARELGHPLS